MKREWIRAVAAVSATVSLSLLLISCAANPEKAKLNYLNKGEGYMKQGQYSSAVIEFRNALKVDPKYVEAYYQLANACIPLRDGPCVGKALSQGIALDPNREDIRLLRGSLSAASHDYASATADANFILKENPKSVGAHRLLGEILTVQKQYDQALQEFSKVAALAPTDPTSYKDLGLINLELRDTTDAEANFKKALEVNPKYIPARIYLVDLYRLQGNPSEAEKTLQEGIQADPKAIPLYLNLATLYTSEKKQSEADNTLSQLSSALPKSTDVAVAVGEYYAQTNRGDRALAEFQRGLSIDPKNVLLQEKVEEIYLDTQRTDLAVKANDELLKQAPNDVIARVDHGRILMAQGKPADAVTTLQKVVADAADSPEAHYYLAIAYSASNNGAQANSELQQTLRVASALPDGNPRKQREMNLALTKLVDLNYAQGKYSVAQLYAQELEQNNQADPSARLLLGQVLLKLGQNDQASDQFTAAEKLAPNNPAVHVNLASLHIAERQIPQAEREYQTALTEAPNSIVVVGDYANFLLAQKQQAKADSLVSEFVSQNSSAPAAHLLMSQMKVVEKDYPAAMAEAQKASQLNPKLPDAYMQIGQIYQYQGNSKAAIQEYEQSMNYTAPSVGVVAKIGDIYLNEGDLSNAAAEFQKALNMDPNFVVAANNLAWIYAEQNQNLDIALGLAQKAKAQDPQVPSFSDTLAWVMYRKGDYAGALPLLQECVRQVPNNAEFHYHLGMVLVADGQKAQGKTQLQAALGMNLDSQEASQARKALGQ